EGIAGLGIWTRHSQFQIHVATGEVLDRRDLGEKLFQAFLEEPVERVALDFDQIRDGRDLVNSRERVPGSTVRESEGDRTSLCERHGLTHTSVVRGDNATRNRQDGERSIRGAPRIATR